MSIPTTGPHVKTVVARAIVEIQWEEELKEGVCTEEDKFKKWIENEIETWLDAKQAIVKTLDIKYSKLRLETQEA